MKKQSAFNHSKGPKKQYSIGVRNIPSYKTLSKRLDAILEAIEALEYLTFKRPAETWYSRANDSLEAIADKTGYSLVKVAAICAVLSPSNNWSRNLLDTETVLINHNPDSAKVCGYPINKLKAYTIKGLEDRDIEAIFYTSRKVYSFYQNLLLNTGYVTIDSWMLRALLKLPLNATVNISNRAYDALEMMFTRYALARNYCPYILQGIVWEYTRLYASELKKGQIEA